MDKNLSIQCKVEAVIYSMSLGLTSPSSCTALSIQTPVGADGFGEETGWFRREMGNSKRARTRTVQFMCWEKICQVKS